MPTYRNPFEKGRLIVQFIVDFPDSIDPKIAAELEKILPPKDEPIIPDEHDEVDLTDFDPESDRRRQRAEMHDDDDDHHHGPGVSCATQ